MHIFEWVYSQMNDRGGTLSYSARQTPNRRPNKNKKLTDTTKAAAENSAAA